MKKIITISVTLIFSVALAVSAQQNSNSVKLASAKDVRATNLNIERMRILNQKMAVEKATVPTATKKVVPVQKSREEVARTKAANRANLPATAPASSK